MWCRRPANRLELFLFTGTCLYLGGKAWQLFGTLPAREQESSNVHVYKVEYVHDEGPGYGW